MLAKGRSLITVSRKQKSAQTIKQEQQKNRQFVQKTEKDYVSTEDLKELARKNSKASANIDASVVQRFGETALSLLPPGYHYNRELGAGSFGVAYQICHSKLRCMALKIVELNQETNEEDAQEELELQQVFAEEDLAPVILGDSQTWTFHNKKYFAFKMARIDGTLESLLKRGNLNKESLDDIFTSLFSLLGWLAIGNKTHGDFHTGNIAFRYVLDDNGYLTLEMLLIDFGFANVNEANIRFELIQLGRTLQIDIKSAEKEKNPVWKSNTLYIWRRVEKVLRNTLGIQDTSLKNLEQMWIAERPERS